MNILEVVYKLKMKLLAFIGLSVILIGTSLFFEGNSKELKENEVQNIKELVQDYSVGNIKNQSASITSHQLIVTESDDNEITYALPDDEFFVSIAPYINETHPCAIHSLTGCTGELTDEEFSVYIEDKEGNEILNQTLKSHANGFIDIWLPRDKTYHVTIEHDGKIAESEISTFEQDNTCIATMQLKETKNS